MNKLECKKTLETLSFHIIDKLHTKDYSVRQQSTIKSIFRDALKLRDEGQLYKKESVTEQAIKGNKNSRLYVIEEIYKMILNLKLPIPTVEDILENYTINYFGTVDDYYKGNKPKFKHFISKIFISKKDTDEVKLRKLAQVVYQDMLGLSIVDEFCYMPIEKTTYAKVEEVSAFSTEDVWIQISGIKERIDNFEFEPAVYKNVISRLSKTAKDNLSTTNTEVETQRMSGDRVTLTCPPYAINFTFNIRLHYEGAIDSKIRLKLGSTSEIAERWLDLIVNFFPNIVVIGGQGTGKTTYLRDIYRRYPANTVIGTIESSFEIHLEKFKHLIVAPLQIIASRDYNKALEDMLRLGLDLMVIGEGRSPQEIMTMVQVMLRQGNGSSTTFHSENATDGLYNMRTLLVRTGEYKSETQAMFELCRALDFAIVLGLENLGEQADGKRFTAEICEIPKVSEEEASNIELRVLFKYDFESETLLKVNDISEEMQQYLLRRKYKPNIMKELLKL